MSGKGPVVAAIDCGTNSTRLLAADAARPLARPDLHYMCTITPRANTSKFIFIYY